MAGTINKVILIGNLGKDPEVRYLENGSRVANFSIATSEVYTDKNTQQKEVGNSILNPVSVTALLGTLVMWNAEHSNPIQYPHQILQKQKTIE